MTTIEVTTEPQDIEPESFEGARAAIDQARIGVSNAIGHVPDTPAWLAIAPSRSPIGSRGRSAACNPAPRKPVTRLQTMPIRRCVCWRPHRSVWVPAPSCGAPRLVTLAGFAPASIFGFAIMSRPRRIHWLCTRLSRRAGAAAPRNRSISTGFSSSRDAGGRSRIGPTVRIRQRKLWTNGKVHSSVALIPTVGHR